jgi:hypothetical protein
LSEQQQRTKAGLDAVVRRLWGAVALTEFLKTQFTTEEDVLDVPENWPRFAFTANGEVKRTTMHDQIEQEGEKAGSFFV